MCAVTPVFLTLAGLLWGKQARRALFTCKDRRPTSTSVSDVLLARTNMSTMSKWMNCGLQDVLDVRTTTEAEDRSEGLQGLRGSDPGLVQAVSIFISVPHPGLALARAAKLRVEISCKTDERPAGHNLLGLAECPSSRISDMLELGWTC